jgi:YesN/AraC family two-component response regulator
MEQRAKLLVVDDEKDITELLKWQLDGLFQTVHTALSGKEALEILRRDEIDILIADIRMPGMDGLELLQHTTKIQPDVQCIFITGHGGVKTAVEAAKRGAFSYLRKPLDMDELGLAIQKAMEKLELIRTVRQMRKEFDREEEVIKEELRAAIFDVMNLSLRYWELASGKSKLDLAEQSGIWTITKDYYEGGRARNLDRYLRISTIPKNPNLNNVLKTGDFVLAKCQGEFPDISNKLMTSMDQLETMHRRLEQLMDSMQTR